MKKIWLAIPLAVAGVLYAFPVQASDGITAVVVPNPIGIPEIMIAITFLGLASWKKTWIRVILSLGLIIWGVFFMPYDIKIAAPLLGIGAVLFFMGILNLIKQYRGGE
jgi:branched-subunit amino acid transport protein AzlD